VLDDLASDFSVFHRIRDVGVLRSTAFLKLAARAGAYNGALAARIAKERRQQAAGPPGRRTRAITAPRYERSTAMANNARAADSAPPATAGSLTAINTQLGGVWFSYRKVPGDGNAVAGGEAG
jgi:hypothetical protein